MSLRTLFSASSEARLEDWLDPSAVDPVEPWKEARRRHFGRFAWAYWLTAAGLGGWLLHTAQKLRTLWLALGLSLLGIVSFTDPSCYYYSMWVVAAVLCRARPALEMPLLGVAALGQAISLRLLWIDDRYRALAVLYVVSACLMVALFARPPRSAARAPRARPAVDT